MAQGNVMKIAAILRVRNEGDIIHDTMRHMSFLDVDEIYVLDDNSTDDTVEVCRSFPKVRHVIEDRTPRRPAWEPSRQAIQRLSLVKYVKVHTDCDWVVCFDADERVDESFLFRSRVVPLTKNAVGIRFNLLDGYMTSECDKDYLPGSLLEDLPRKWGPERRRIIFMWKVEPLVRIFTREPDLNGYAVVNSNVWIKHYGKCISRKHWYNTVEFYKQPEHSHAFRKKWMKRNADNPIHSESSFGAPLYDWTTAKQVSFQRGFCR